MDDSPEERGLLDTSVVIDLDILPAESVPEDMYISAITLGELAAGPHAVDDLDERAERQRRLLFAEREFDVLPFDVDAAHAFGSVNALVRGKGRNTRGRIPDLQIASVAVANGLPLYTRNPKDFVGLEAFLTVVAV